MINVLTIILSVFVYVFIGYILKKFFFIPKKIEKVFTFFSFNLLLPLALIINFWLITFPEIYILKLLFSFFGAGVIIFIIGFIIGKLSFNFETDDCAIFGLGACFGNSVALGIPLMYSILGPVNAMPYMILVLFHGVIHFTYTTFIIEGYRNRNKSSLKKIIYTVLGLAQNLVLAGMLIGLTLNYFNVTFNENLKIYSMPISKFALPTVLISMGIALAGFKINLNLYYPITLTILKNFVYPLIAFVFSKYLFNLPSLLVFIVTMAAALPSGTQTYYFSYRYNSLKNIISANVVISTFTSFFTLSILLMIFNH